MQVASLCGRMTCNPKSTYISLANTGTIQEEEQKETDFICYKHVNK